ncbi:MAG: AAA domain-containing protein [Janthinobacterium lividum]
MLVTALTNRALLELAVKPQLAVWREQGHVLKLSLSTDEQAEAPGLHPATRLISQAGTLVLATFHMASFAAVPPITGQQVVSIPFFDYVLVDEASQALLATLALARSLGHRHLWVGDPAQLPPVVRQRPELVRLPGAIRGLVTVSQYAGLPAFRLSRTFRLPPRAARFTGLFYNNDLTSAEMPNGVFPLATSSPLLRQVLHPAGGPVLIPLDLPAGEESPAPALLLIKQLVADLFQTAQPLSVAVLTHRRATSRSIQHLLTHQVVPARSLLIVDTVARVQGLTCDVCLFVIPAIGYAHSLQAATFNVATSRARHHTIILAAPSIRQAGHPTGPVAQYLKLLLDDPSDEYLQLA